MNFTTIKQELEKGNVSPIYLLTGDAFFIDKTVNIFKEYFNIQDMSYSFFNDENFDTRQVICACQQFSFFGDKRIVVVSNITKELNNEGKKQFLAYEKNPNKDCILIIKNSLDDKVFDFLKSSITIECVANETYYINYINQQLKEHNISAENGAVKKLLTYCLNDFTRINNELQKLCAYLKDDKTLTEQIVDDLVYKDTELKVYDLTSALSNKNINRAQEVLTLMFKAEEQPTKIIALIYSHFKRLFFVKLNKDKSKQELANLLGVKEFAITKSQEQGKNISIIKLKDIEHLCLEVDYMIKSGQMAPDNAVYFLVYKIYNILQ